MGFNEMAETELPVIPRVVFWMDLGHHLFSHYAMAAKFVVDELRKRIASGELDEFAVVRVRLEREIFDGFTAYALIARLEREIAEVGL